MLVQLNLPIVQFATVGDELAMEHVRGRPLLVLTIQLVNGHAIGCCHGMTESLEMACAVNDGPATGRRWRSIHQKYRWKPLFARLIAEESAKSTNIINRSPFQDRLVGSIISPDTCLNTCTTRHVHTNPIHTGHAMIAAAVQEHL